MTWNQPTIKMKKKIEETNEGFSNPPHPLSFHQTTFKYENATNAKTTPFNCALHKKQKGQEAEKSLY